MNGDGVTLTNLENTVCLKAYGLNNVLSQTTKDYFESNKESIGVDISYEALFDNSYILSWEENNLIYYQYTVVGTGCFNAFCISYPKEEKEKFINIIIKVNLSNNKSFPNHQFIKGSNRLYKNITHTP